MKDILNVAIFVSLLFVPSAIWAGETQMRPSEGWTLHVDAKKHVPGLPEMLAHHYCKAVRGGVTECQLYDSDGPDARLIGVEVIVDAETYKKLDEKEKPLWHYHKTEIPKVEARMPELSPEEEAKTLKGFEETYGKVYILWDPKGEAAPLGRPVVHSIP